MGMGGLGWVDGLGGMSREFASARLGSLEAYVHVLCTP